MIAEYKTNLMQGLSNITRCPQTHLVLLAAYKTFLVPQIID